MKTSVVNLREVIDIITREKNERESNEDNVGK